MQASELYMRRCFELARLGQGTVAPNPMVGAVIVHGDRIIGEGYHKRYGQDHAEVNAVQAVRDEHRYLLPDSTLYVSLEPCSFHGNTPACTDLILRERIPRVVVSCLDLTPEVSGQGVRRLREQGVEVEVGLLAEQGRALAQSRNVFVTQQRPFVTLKYAQTSNGYFAPSGNRQFWISNAYSKRLVHRLRAEHAAIVVGTRTARIDNPQLNNRLYGHRSPLRIVLDRTLVLPPDLRVFDGSQPTVVVTEREAKDRPNLSYWQLDFRRLLPQLLQRLFQEKIGTLLVEGGVTLLRQFIEQEQWDTAYVFTGNAQLSDGLPAPLLPYGPKSQIQLAGDQLSYFENHTQYKALNLL